MSDEGKPKPQDAESGKAEPGSETEPESQPESQPQPESGSKPAPESELAVGTVLAGVYRIEAVTSRGEGRRAYEARSLEQDSRHLVEPVPAALAADAAAMERLVREAGLLRYLEQEAVAGTDGIVRDAAGRAHLVRDLVEGPTLATVLAKGALAPEAVRRLRIRLGRGLMAAHEIGVVHRELSPETVILPEGDPAKAVIVDFGLFGLAEPAVKSLEAEAEAGALAYAAPEQLGHFGGKVDARTDIYALGLVLAAAALGRGLDQGKTMVTLLRDRQSQPDLAGVPEALRGDLETLLKPDPKDRPANLGDVIVAEEAASMAARLAPVTGPGAVRKQSSRLRGFALAGGLVVLVVLVGVATRDLWMGPPAGTETAGAPESEAAQPAETQVAESTAPAPSPEPEGAETAPSPNDEGLLPPPEMPAGMEGTVEAQSAEPAPAEPPAAAGAPEATEPAPATAETTAPAEPAPAQTQEAAAAPAPEPLAEAQAESPAEPQAEAPAEAQAEPEMAAPLPESEPVTEEPSLAEAAAPGEAERFDAALSDGERREVQRALRSLGHYYGAIDGLFGPGTRAGIAAFQDSIETEPDGFVSASQLRDLRALAPLQLAEAPPPVTRSGGQAATAAAGPRATLAEALRTRAVEAAPDSVLGSGLAWLTQRAEGGDRASQSRLGLRYLHGQGAPRDLGKAVTWLRRGAEQGDPKGQYNLGLLFESGTGVARDTTQAADWLAKAAAQNEPGAQQRLDRLIERGLAAPPS